MGMSSTGSFNVLILNLALFDLLLAIVGVSLRGPAMVVTNFFQLNPVVEGLCKVKPLKYLIAIDILILQIYCMVSKNTKSCGQMTLMEATRLLVHFQLQRLF